MSGTSAKGEMRLLPKPAGAWGALGERASDWRGMEKKEVEEGEEKKRAKEKGKFISKVRGFRRTGHIGSGGRGLGLDCLQHTKADYLSMLSSR